MKYRVLLLALFQFVTSCSDDGADQEGTSGDDLAAVVDASPQTDAGAADADSGSTPAAPADAGRTTAILLKSSEAFVAEALSPTPSADAVALAMEVTAMLSPEELSYLASYDWATLTEEQIANDPNIAALFAASFTVAYGHSTNINKDGPFDGLAPWCEGEGEDEVCHECGKLIEDMLKSIRKYVAVASLTTTVFACAKLAGPSPGNAVSVAACVGGLGLAYGIYRIGESRWCLVALDAGAAPRALVVTPE